LTIKVVMISLSSLSAFSQEASRIRPGQGVDAPRPVQPIKGKPVEGADVDDVSAKEASTPQRVLGSVPPMPDRPLPRGSLLDLKV
jgi:hypothetical protein